MTETPRRTKIVATLGPASSSEAALHELLTAGVDVVRLNFSHGTHEAHGAAIQRVRGLAGSLDRPVAIMADLQGPKIRVGRLSAPVQLEDGGRVRIRHAEETDPLPREPGLLTTTYAHLAQDVKPGDMVLIDDGKLALKVESTDGVEAVLRVVHGGEVKEHKGINLPWVQVSTPSLTPKDDADLKFALAAGVDAVALSFVRDADDLRKLRRRMDEYGGRVPVVAKIEKPEAVKHLEDVVQEADVVMVARGDLGVELGPEDVPVLQKRIIAACIEAGRPVITATQMLESMIEFSRPTRAEASDVANAIFDGTDAVMLSAETASGRFPVEAVATMDRIARRTEQELHLHCSDHRKLSRHRDLYAAASVHAAAVAAEDLAAKAIVVFTISGRTAGLVSQLRPPMPIYAFTPDRAAYRRLAMTWGVQPLFLEHAENTDVLVERGENVLLERGLVARGDPVVMITGTTTLTGATNLVKLHRIGGGAGTIIRRK